MHHGVINDKKPQKFVVFKADVCVFFFTSSRFVGPPLASARSGLLPRDTAGGQRDCQRNRTPATAQPIPTQAGCCPSVQGDLNRYRRPHCSYCESDMSNRSFSSQSLDFSTKRMIHEGPLTWKVNKDKQIGQRVFSGYMQSHGFGFIPL